MGIETDQEIFQLVGSDTIFIDGLAPCFQEAMANKVFTQKQAWEWLGTKLRTIGVRRPWGHKMTNKTKADEARDILASVVLSHIPVRSLDYRLKALHLAIMVRRIIQAVHDKSYLDDRDYYGNKRLEL